MLSRNKIEIIAENFLRKEGHPFQGAGSVTFPEEAKGDELKEYLSESGFASVCFDSNDASNEFIPSVFIVYVNLITGEVHMPRHRC